MLFTQLLTLSLGDNSVLLEAPIYLATRTCYSALQTGDGGVLYLRNTGPPSVDFVIGDVSMAVYISQAQGIMVPIHWDEEGQYEVTFQFSSFVSIHSTL